MNISTFFNCRTLQKNGFLFVKYYFIRKMLKNAKQIMFYFRKPESYGLKLCKDLCEKASANYLPISPSGHSKNIFYEGSCRSGSTLIKHNILGLSRNMVVVRTFYPALSFVALHKSYLAI